MSDIKLTTPEGYFEESLQRTMASVSREKSKRRTLLCSCAAVLLLLVTAYYTVNASREEREYLAYQDEAARLDIFLEVNE